MDIGLLQQANLFVERLQAGLDDLLDHRLGLALAAEFIGQNILFSRHRLRIESGSGRSPADWRPQCAWRPAGRSAVSSSALPVRFQGHDDADLAEPFRYGVMDIARRRRPALTDTAAARRNVMFSPMVAMAELMASSIVSAPTLPALMASDIGADVERDIGDHA